MATMHDVAVRAGVSGATVSHVLNSTRPVSEETRRRVEDAISATGYRHNSLARALAAGRTSTIGICMPIRTNQYIADLVNAVETAAGAEGYTLLLGDSRDEADAEASAVQTFLERRVDGIIMAAGAHSAESTIPQILSSGTPLTLIDRPIEGLDCDQVVSENAESVRGLTAHLLGHGHRSFLVVKGRPGIRSTDERFAGFQSAIADHTGPAIEWQAVDGGANVAMTTDAVLRHLRDVGVPDAILTLNNAMTIGSMRATRELGLSIPADVALASFDDFEWADLFAPRLTAIAQDVRGMGTLAVERLLERIAAPDSPTRMIRLPTTLNIRDSCGPHS
jgi:LacI family transcriptional regulator